MSRLLVVSAVLFSAVAVMAIACGGDEDEASDAVGTVERAVETPRAAVEGGADRETQLQITAQNLEFDKDELKAPPNVEVTIEFRNEDEGVLHNVAFYRSRDARDPIYVGEIFAGADSRTYQFTTPAAGEYFFRCDVHPDTMNGAFKVED